MVSVAPDFLAAVLAVIGSGGLFVSGRVLAGRRRDQPADVRHASYKIKTLTIEPR